MSLVDQAVSRVPQPYRDVVLRHHELIKFAIVGGTTMVFDLAIFYSLSLTILEQKPVIAKIISGVMATILSYILNREWSFKNRGGRERHHEALLFFTISGVGVAVLHRAPGDLAVRVPPRGARGQPPHPGDRRVRERPGPRRAPRHGVPLVGVLRRFVFPDVDVRRRTRGADVDEPQGVPERAAVPRRTTTPSGS